MSIGFAYFLAAFYTFVAFFYAVIINKHQRAHKNTTYLHVGNRFTLHWWNHITFRVFRLTIWFVCVLRIPFPEIDTVLGVFNWPDYTLNYLGALLLTLGFGIAIVTNFQMRDAWRSGIDTDNTNELVTHGLFAISRNPSYVGVASAQVGFFMALPSVFSAICLIVGLSALRIQITLEERHLANQFGVNYQQYRDSVPRWL
jgi:protein-S-isoprenylcysteine O-methyltransferase Ste14